MFIAIDDTYGLAGSGLSEYVTKDRRSHIAILFKDDEVEYVRSQMRECLDELNKELGADIEEFHFADIYNRTGRWAFLKDAGEPINLAIFSAFAEIYCQHRWPVRVQTVDDRTLKDHPSLGSMGKVDGFNLGRREDLSLLMLLSKLRHENVLAHEPCTVLVDEGIGKPGSPFGRAIFSRWPRGSCGFFSSSREEPLLQIADFVAFCINRSTHLSLKEERSVVDNGFLKLVGTMSVNSPDLDRAVLPLDFRTVDVDRIHKAGRARKGLEPPTGEPC